MMPKRQDQKFNFKRFKQRHVALKILYFGWDYDGLAAQQDSSNTIEYHLFDALTKTCLVESRELCHFNRCGRTDKGVSSYGQVVNLNIRSNLVDETHPQNLGLFTPPDYIGGREVGDDRKPVQEIRYTDILNRVLPSHIKVIAWAPVRTDSFSARFSCRSRSYSYVFPIGNLNVDAMRSALSYLEGEHDFRNLCSFDLKHGVVNHKRTILSTSIEPILFPQSTSELPSTSPKNPYSFYQVVIVGQAFLFHQIRCIMTILFLVGTGKEDPTVVRDLLDIKTCPARPNYNRASPMPLCLFNCKYDSSDLPLGWIHDSTALHNLFRHLKHLWLQYRTKAIMIERAFLNIEEEMEECDEPSGSSKRIKLDTGNWKDFGLEHDNMSDTKYILLLKRPRDETLEEKLKTLEDKKKEKSEENVEDSSSR